MVRGGSAACVGGLLRGFPPPGTDHVDLAQDSVLVLPLLGCAQLVLEFQKLLPARTPAPKFDLAFHHDAMPSFAQPIQVKWNKHSMAARQRPPRVFRRCRRANSSFFIFHSSFTVPMKNEERRMKN